MSFKQHLLTHIALHMSRCGFEMKACGSMKGRIGRKYKTEDVQRILSDMRQYSTMYDLGRYIKGHKI